MLHGDKANRFNHDAPVPGPGEPDVPVGLSEAQAREWHKVTGWLRGMQMLHAADGSTILAYVVVTEKLTRLTKRMTDEPEIVRNPSNGLPMQNPVFDQWLKAVSKMETLSNKLGLNPSARSGIQTKATAATMPPSRGGPVDRLFS